MLILIPKQSIGTKAVHAVPAKLVKFNHFGEAGISTMLPKIDQACFYQCVEAAPSMLQPFRWSYLNHFVAAVASIF